MTTIIPCFPLHSLPPSLFLLLLPYFTHCLPSSLSFSSLSVCLSICLSLSPSVSYHSSLSVPVHIFLFCVCYWFAFINILIYMSLCLSLSSDLSLCLSVPVSASLYLSLSVCLSWLCNKGEMETDAWLFTFPICYPIELELTHLLTWLSALRVKITRTNLMIVGGTDVLCRNS